MRGFLAALPRPQGVNRHTVYGMTESDLNEWGMSRLAMHETDNRLSRYDGLDGPVRHDAELKR